MGLEGGILRENFAEKTLQEINTLVTQKQLDEKKVKNICLMISSQIFNV